MLTDLETVKSLLRISPGDPQGDVVLEYLLAGVDSAVKGFCKRQFEASDYTEFYSGPGTPDLVLHNRPVSAVASVWVDPQGFYGQRSGSFGPTTLLVPGVDFCLKIDAKDGTQNSNSGLLTRLGSSIVGDFMGFFAEFRRGTLTTRLPPVWARGIGNIKVQYTAGYTDENMPADLITSVVSLVGILRAGTPIGTPIVDAGNFADAASKLLVRPAGIGEPEVATIRETLRRYRDFAI